MGALWPQVHKPTRIVLSENETCVNHRAFFVQVVSAVIGGCKTPSGSPSSTGFEPGADEAADPSASTLLLFAAELATTLLLAALGFPSKLLIVLLDHSKRDVGR